MSNVSEKLARQETGNEELVGGKKKYQGDAPST